MVEWKKDDTVAILIMNNGENRQNPDWTEAILAIYAEIIADQDIKSIVLTSSDSRNFSLGVDTDWLQARMQAQDFTGLSQWLYRNNEVFQAMLMAPVPTIAAVTGHAFGNGAMLAGACDFRFMRADRGFLCLPEIDLGIQFTPSMTEWMKRIMPYHLFIRLQYTGEKIGAAELERHGVILKACADAGKTLEEAVAFARTLTKPRVTLAEMKRRTYKHIIDKMEKEDPAYIDYIPEATREGRLPVFMLTPGK